MHVKALAIAAVLTLSSNHLPPPPASLPPAAPPVCHHNCQVDDTGFALIRGFEGFSRYPYKDVAGVPTIGYGHAIRKGEHISVPLLAQDAQKLLESDLKVKSAAVNKLVKVPLRAGQFDALSSFTYNLGQAVLAKSTLLRKVNAQQHAAVPEQFMRYDHAGGRVVKGLQLRRRAEAALYIQAVQ